MPTNNNSHFPRFPATSRITHREKRPIAALVQSQTAASMLKTEEQQQQDDENNAEGSQTARTPPSSSSSRQQQFLPAINNGGAGSSLLVQATRPVHPSASTSPAAAASLALVPLSGTANLATVAASVLCDVTARYRGTFTTQDIDVEQQRRAFTRVVEKVASEAENSKSAAIFCETLFMHVKQSIDSATLLASARTAGTASAAAAPSQDDFAGLRIAAACWALDVISRSNTSFSFILQDIKRLLFPAVFVGFNAVEDACKQRAKAQPALSGSAALVSSAPYVVCDLFYQRYAKDQRRIRQLNENKETTTLKLQRNKVGAGSILRTLNRQMIATVFRAWHGFTRRQHIERFARNMLKKNGFRESRSTKLDAAFSRWRLMVGQNHNATLTERCHHLQHQLENAKGQFQLQCFRADKYLRVVEELREELRGARDTREELHKENIRLQAQLEAFQVQARERLEAHVSLICAELHKWKQHVAAQDREEREKIEASMKFADRAHMALRGRDSPGAGGSVTPTSSALEPPPSAGGGGGGRNSSAFGSGGSEAGAELMRSSNEDNGNPLMQQAKEANKQMVSAMDGDAGESVAALNFSSIAATTASASQKSEAILLQWCTWAVQQCPIATVKGVANFATDFINGEVIIIAMNVAAPHHVSLMLLQDVHPIRRLERAMESGKKAGLTHLPKVSDFAEGNADLIVLAVAEIFHLWCSKSRLIAGDGEAVGSKDGKDDGKSSKKKRHSKRGGGGGGAAAADDESGGEASLDASASAMSLINEDGASLIASSGDAVTPVVTSDELPKYLDDCTQALEKYRDNHASAISRDRLLWRLELGALNRAAFIARERLEGRSVTVLDRKDMIRFTSKVQKSRFANLQNRYRMAPLDYSGTPWMHFELQLDLLRESLHTFYPDLRRCFTYYCNGGATMNSAGYWSFCNDIRVVEPRVISRTHLDRVFVMANLEDISQASVDPLLSFEDDLLNEAAAEDEDENTETLLIPSEFVECVIRIADLRIKDKMLHEKFALLMKDYVNVYACKSETDKFRREINSTAILSITDRFKKDLNKIFVHFSHRKPGSGNKTRYMSVNDFVFFAKESYLHSAAMDESAIQQIFDKVASPTDDMSGRELLQHEFLDALVCVSFYKFPSPFVPLEKKIEQTCSTLIGFLRGRLKGLVTLSKEAPSSPRD